MPKTWQSASPAEAYQRYNAGDGRQGLIVDETVSPVVELTALEHTPFASQLAAPTSLGAAGALPPVGWHRYYVIQSRDTTGLVAFEIELIRIHGVGATGAGSYQVLAVTEAEGAAWEAGAIAFGTFPNLNSPERNGLIALTRPVLQTCQLIAAALPTTGVLVASDELTLYTLMLPFPKGCSVRQEQAWVVLGPIDTQFGVTVQGRVWTQARPRNE